MKQMKLLLMVIAVTSVFLGCGRDVGAEEKNDRWAYFGTINTGDVYYDQSSIKYVRPQVLTASMKMKYSKEGKDNYIKFRKENKMSTAGWERIDNYICLEELDCEKKTKKMLKKTDYDNAGNILDNKEIPNPEIEQIIPDSMGDHFLKAVCHHRILK